MRPPANHHHVAQLDEHDPPKVEDVGSSPIVVAKFDALDDEPDKRAGAALKTDGRREALRCKPAVTPHLDSEPARRRPRLEIEWALRRWGSGPPLSATLESQPDRRAGTASNTDGTERCEAHVLGSPP